MLSVVILDQVKNKETYKDAVEILQRFGNDRTLFTTPSRTTVTPSNVSMDKKIMMSAGTNAMTPTTAFKTPAARKLANVQSNIGSLQERLRDNAPMTPMNQNRSLISSNVSVIGAANTRRTPYPIVDNTQKTVVDKMVDYLIGDGPANRFAMICQQCFKHNGMRVTSKFIS